MVNTKEIKIDIPEEYEIDKENSTFECIKFKEKSKEINTWKDIEYLSGYFINNQASIIETPEILRESDDKNVFVSKKYAKSALALAQISQLMPYYGGEITDEEWKNDELKYCLIVDSNGFIYPHSRTHSKQLVAFHTPDQRRRFLSFPENKQLILDLYMIE